MRIVNFSRKLSRLNDESRWCNLFKFCHFLRSTLLHLHQQHPGDEKYSLNALYQRSHAFKLFLKEYIQIDGTSGNHSKHFFTLSCFDLSLSNFFQCLKVREIFKIFVANWIVKNNVGRCTYIKNNKTSSWFWQ